jgi:hypothetical protein
MTALRQKQRPSEKLRVALIGVEKCGCVTYANSRPDAIDQWDVKILNALRKRGGTVVTTTVAKARRRKHFLPAECPHDPKGWEGD